MLLALATLDDLDSANWGDAYDDFFLSHLWHQFTIYPVTPVATGLLLRIASLRSSTAVAPATQIALGLRLVAETTAIFRNHTESAKRALGELTAALGGLSRSRSRSRTRSSVDRARRST